MHERGMSSAIFFSIYVFIMTFYFLNILIGFIVYFMQQGEQGNMVTLEFTYNEGEMQTWVD